MRLKNLCDVYVYEPISIKKDGETSLKWKYKGHQRINRQQDIGELDINSAGIIDFDKYKLRFDYNYDIQKNDGISFEKLDIENDYTLLPPQYHITSKTKVGKSILCSCEIYYGE